MNGSKFIPAIAMLAILSGAAWAQSDWPANVPKADIAPIIKSAEVAAGIYQFTVDSDGYVEQLNSTIIVTERDVVVFDTDTRPSSARAILAQTKKITPKPVHYIVNSHWHPDHWSGNQVYLESFPNAEIIATEKTRELMMDTAANGVTYLKEYIKGHDKRFAAKIATGKDASGKLLGKQELTKAAYDHFQFRDLVNEQAEIKHVYPTLTYTGEMVLRDGGREFHFMSVDGDAAGTTVLFLPNEKVLITGDAVTAPLPSCGPNVLPHVKALRELAKLDWNVLVPGHGPAFHDRAYLNLEADFMEEIDRQVQAALRRGLATIEDVQAAVHVENFRDRFLHGQQRPPSDDFPVWVNVIARVCYLNAREGQEIHASDLQ
jgi:glyoxylase-like metal-dependent hydrolase (beta-lactamase superfamily II)